jgi:hypothetical protein
MERIGRYNYCYLIGGLVNSKLLGFLMMLAGLGLIVHGVVMKFFIHAPLVHMATAEDKFFLKPPPVRTGVPDYVPIIAGMILLALGILIRLGK